MEQTTERYISENGISLKERQRLEEELFLYLFKKREAEEAVEREAFQSDILSLARYAAEDTMAIADVFFETTGRENIKQQVTND